MSNKNILKYWSIALTLLIIGAAMWILNCLTPESIDDFWYKYKFVIDKIYTTDPITSFRDILISQYNHWFTINGRTVVHIIVQIFTGLFGKTIFNIFNAGIFICFICILTRLTTKVSALNILFVSALVLILFPVFGQTMLWMAGSINYLWASTAVCAFLLAVEGLKDKSLQWKHLLSSILCILAGWSHEGIVFPMAISLVIYIVIERKTIFRQAQFPLIAGFIIGALVCTLSPSIFSRANMDAGISLYWILQKVNSGLTLCLKLRIFWLLLCVIVVKYNCINREKRWSWLKAFYVDNIIVFNAMILSFGVVFGSGYMLDRTAIGVELFSLILLLILLKDLSRVLKAAVCVAGWILYICILIYSVHNYRDSIALISQIETAESDIIVFKEEKHYPSVINSYITCIFKWFDEESMWNRLMAATYHREKIAFVPEIIYNDIISDSDNIKDINKQKDYPYYVIQISEEEKNKQPLYVLNPAGFDSLPFYIRPFASRLTRYTATEIPVTSSYFGRLEINGRSYLFVGKNKMIDDRLKDIVITR